MVMTALQFLKELVVIDSDRITSDQQNQNCHSLNLQCGIMGSLSTFVVKQYKIASYLWRNIGLHSLIIH